MNNFVFEFIEDFKNDLKSGFINPDLPINAVIDKKELDNDPNFNDLNNALKSIGFNIEILNIRKQTAFCKISKLN